MGDMAEALIKTTLISLGIIVFLVLIAVTKGLILLTLIPVGIFFIVLDSIKDRRRIEERRKRRGY